MAEIAYVSDGGVDALVERVAGRRGISGEVEFDVLCDGFPCRARAAFDTWEAEPMPGGGGPVEPAEESGATVTLWLAGMDQNSGKMGLSRQEAGGVLGAAAQRIAKELLAGAMDGASRQLARTPAFQALIEARELAQAARPAAQGARAKASL